jgi:hypothetical protein
MNSLPFWIAFLFGFVSGAIFLVIIACIVVGGSLEDEE